MYEVIVAGRAEIYQANTSNQEGVCMQRRDVLKLLGSTVALSALPREALAVLIEANAAATHNGGLKTLNAHQDATVVMISEMIIPETDTPGAKGAKVNEFIDLLLSEWFEPEETKQFL